MKKSVPPGLIQDFVLARSADPLIPARDLWADLAKKAGYEGNLSPAIQIEINAKWQEFLQGNLQEIPVIIEVPGPSPEFDWKKEIDNLPVDILMEVVGRKLGSLLRGLANFQQLSRYAEEKPVSTIKPVLVKMAVVGLLPDQQQFVQEATNSLPVDLRFMDAKAAAKQINGSVRFVVVNKHSGHAAWEQAQKKVGHGNVFFCTGITRVIEQIKSLVS